MATLAFVLSHTYAIQNNKFTSTRKGLREFGRRNVASGLGGAERSRSLEKARMSQEEGRQRLERHRHGLPRPCERRRSLKPCPVLGRPASGRGDVDQCLVIELYVMSGDGLCLHCPVQ